MSPDEARRLTFEARVKRTVQTNLDEVARFAQAGNSGSYFKPVWRDDKVNQAAAEALKQKGYRVQDGHVNW